MHLVFLRLSALGDILRVLPAWCNLHQAFPAARLQAVVEDRHAFLLEPFPWLEPVILIRKHLSSPMKALVELKRVAALVKGADVSLDFHGILKSALIPLFAKIPERWGDGITKEGAGWLQNHHVSFLRRSRYQQALGLAEAFGEHQGVAGLGCFNPVLKDIPLPFAGQVWEEDGRPRVVLVPGASKRGANKRWPLEHWMRLASQLRPTHQLRWSLGPEEQELRNWLPEKSRVPALPELPLWPLASLLREADQVITPDTGLLHLAVLLGVPVLALFGPSDPVIAGIPEGAGQVLRIGMDCSPCRERRCLRRYCMAEILPEKVREQVTPARRKYK